jgi:hypothetical protein
MELSCLGPGRKPSDLLGETMKSAKLTCIMQLRYSSRWPSQFRWPRRNIPPSTTNTVSSI